MVRRVQSMYAWAVAGASTALIAGLIVVGIAVALTIIFG